jgi:hypothetical protein
MLKHILVYTAEQEQAIEQLRRQLCKMHEFEPFTACRRIDRKNIGRINAKGLC